MGSAQMSERNRRIGEGSERKLYRNQMGAIPYLTFIRLFNIYGGSMSIEMRDNWCPNCDYRLLVVKDGKSYFIFENGHEITSCPNCLVKLYVDDNGDLRKET